MSDQPLHENFNDKFARIAGSTLLTKILQDASEWTHDERDIARVFIKAHAYAQQGAIETYLVRQTPQVWYGPNGTLIAYSRANHELVRLAGKKVTQIEKAMSAAFAEVAVEALQ